jgi:hypothetical protein
LIFLYFIFNGIAQYESGVEIKAVYQCSNCALGLWIRLSDVISDVDILNGACNRSPGSKLLSIITQLHCGGHLDGRARLPDTILEKDHPMTIPSKFGSD